MSDWNFLFWVCLDSYNLLSHSALSVLYILKSLISRATLRARCNLFSFSFYFSLGFSELACVSSAAGESSVSSFGKLTMPLLNVPSTSQLLSDKMLTLPRIWPVIKISYSSTICTMTTALSLSIGISCSLILPTSSKVMGECYRSPEALKACALTCFFVLLYLMVLSTPLPFSLMLTMYPELMSMVE